MNKPDYLFIKNLVVETRIGVHVWEQSIHQTLLIDITIPSNFNHCPDELSYTLDYDLLCKKVTEHIQSQSFQLIETVANNAALFIKDIFLVDSVSVSVSKLNAVKNASTISVTVNR